MMARQSTPVSSCSSITNNTPIDYVENLRKMLRDCEQLISKDGSSQLQRMITSIDRPEEVLNKPMKPVSLGVLNTVDLCFLIVSLLERRLISHSEECDAIKRTLKKAVDRINSIEHRINELYEYLRKQRQHNA